VVDIRFFRAAIHTEAGGIYLIIPLPERCSRPSLMAFNSKMILPIYGKRTIAEGWFQNPLREFDAGRYTTSIHLRNGDVVVFFYVRLDSVC